MEQTSNKKRKRVVGITALEPENEARVLDLARMRRWSISQTTAYLIELGLQKLDEQPGANGAQLNKSARFYDQIS